MAQHAHDSTTIPRTRPGAGSHPGIRSASHAGSTASQIVHQWLHASEDSDGWGPSANVSLSWRTQDG
jgi:hypothetical protein